MSDQTIDTTVTNDTQTTDTPVLPTDNQQVLPPTDGGQIGGGSVSTFDKDLLTDPKVKALVEAKRSEERAKLHDSLEKHRKLNETLAQERSELLKREEELQRQLREAQNQGKSESEIARSDIEDLRLQLKKFEEKHSSEVEKLKQENERILEVSAQQITDLRVQNQLKDYMKERIAKENISLGHLVKGNTKEEIEASITEIKAMEESIATRVREEERKRLGDSIPRPLAPDTSSAPSSSPRTSDRRSLAGLRGADYEKARAQLLEEARKSLGR